MDILPTLFATSLAATAASLLYWVSLRWRARWNQAGDKLIARLNRFARPQLLRQPTEKAAARIRWLMGQAGMAADLGTFVAVSVASGMAGGWGASTLKFLPLTVAVGGACGLIPYGLLKQRVQARRISVNRAVGPALMQVAKLAEVRAHPYLALSDALGSMRPPLRAELERAIRDYQGNMPLGDALRGASKRLGNNHYVQQLAELTDLTIQSGTSYSQALHRLLDRYTLMEELKAEEQTNMHGYKLLTWVLFLASLAPVPYWVLSDRTTRAAFTNPTAQWMVLWAFLTGIAIALLPSFFATEEV